MMNFNAMTIMSMTQQQKSLLVEPPENNSVPGGDLSLKGCGRGAHSVWVTRGPTATLRSLDEKFLRSVAKVRRRLCFPGTHALHTEFCGAWSGVSGAINLFRWGKGSLLLAFWKRLLLGARRPRECPGPRLLFDLTHNRVVLGPRLSQSPDEEFLASVTGSCGCEIRACCSPGGGWSR